MKDDDTEIMTSGRYRNYLIGNKQKMLLMLKSK